MLDRDIQTLLRSPFVQEINFSVSRGTVIVSGPGFLALSNHLSDDYIPQKLWVRPTPGLIGPRSEAIYNSGQDTLRVRSNTVLHTPFGRGVVVHECTHAQIDLRGMNTPLPSNEAAAYIAEAWYHLACVQDIAAIAPELLAVIVPIATDLRARSKQAGGAVVELTPEQVNQARRAMVDHFQVAARDSVLGNGIGRGRGSIYREP
ncbi:MAG: hypothetical protein HY000_27190 [Planctomycetes bacterium]|nr:hypothetical protein [Planctomycetota bacterium]